MDTYFLNNKSITYLLKVKNLDQVRRVQDMASDKVVWILSNRPHLGAHLGKVFFRTHFLQGLFTRYPISKSYLYLKIFFVIFTRYP